MTYKDLGIWQIANKLVIRIHKMTLEKLPAFELYEVGSQIRRSPKSSKLLIAEGYGRRIYKQDFIRFLINPMASNDETSDHPGNLYNTGSLKDSNLFNELRELAERLGRRINEFMKSVELKHNKIFEPEAEYSKIIRND